MSFISNILGGGAKGILDGIGGIIDEVTTTDEERMAAKLKVQELLHKENEQVEMTFRRELEAKERILVAELQQSDGYTKRARPSIVYTGLLIALASATSKFLGSDVDPSTLVPVEFWFAWGGVTGTWVVGRTMEKRGISNGLTRKITGSKLLD